MIFENLLIANPIQYLYIVLKFVVLFQYYYDFLYVWSVFSRKYFWPVPGKHSLLPLMTQLRSGGSDGKSIDMYGLLFQIYLSNYILLKYQSVPAGMLFAFGYHMLKKHHILDDHNHGYLFSRGLGFIAAFASFAGILVWILI